MMHKRFLFFFAPILVFLLSCNVAGKEPSVAGSFYPADQKQLRETVENFLFRTKKIEYDGRLIALISPHAGYIYSGQVAAHGYRQIAGSNIERVVLIGPSHRSAFEGASVYTEGYFRTPLGKVKVDENFAKGLIDEKAGVKFYPEAFEKEHSIEVQLPFLQAALKDFTIVPILVGSPTRKTFEYLVARLTETADDNTLIVASTDLSHYHNYQTAKAMDSRIVSAVERISVINTTEYLKAGESEMCGAIPVVIAMEVAKRLGANLGMLFDYANSGDVTGQKEAVVGYASIGLIKSPYTDVEKKELLAIARKAIAEYVGGKSAPEIETTNPKLKADGAAFVTIKKNNSLRGCVGHAQAVMPLYMSVITNAIAASSADPRFHPITKEELNDVDIEISVLSPLKRVKNTNEILIGRHGLIIKKGIYSGLLLPQVAVEQGWDRRAFLENLCAKAGLQGDAWKDAELYSFTAEKIK